MGLWKFVRKLFGTARIDRQPGDRRAPLLETILETDTLEERNTRSALCPIAAPEYAPAAEVIHVAPAYQRRYSGSTSRFRRLSIAVVDYLLEHEWLSLLAGHPTHSSKRQRREPQNARYITSDHMVSAEQQGQTFCSGTSDSWSVTDTSFPATGSADGAA